MAEAEAMYRRALEGKEKAWGPEHTSTLDTEKAWGPEHTSTLGTVNNLGVLYKDQGKMAEAEAMYRRALEGKEKA
ncbi:beta transducin-like protein het-e4s [Lasallia pustulata]|uniref:Beta transducin-like protein het-e4s n=1 Tax=Lasallia pustulata TaxID=136370 RepID=A0A1W5D4B0_9LECA|nr:beta transducin-like protein het-e4s [Lasallia pustulata]